MNILTGFTDSPSQTTTFTLEDGSSATINLYYRQQQAGWFYDLAYGEFSVFGQRIVASPNMIRQFREQIPFGLATLTTSKQDPTLQEDFSDGSAVIILLDSVDVIMVENANFVRND